MYTLRVPRSKIYVVKSPRFALLVDRHAKQISFGPYAVEFVRRFLQPSSNAMEALSVNMREDGCWGLRPETIKVMHEAMSPGRHLDATTQILAKCLYPHLALLQAAQPSDQISLFAWLRHIMTQATTDAIYGCQHNPFHNLEIEKGFWSVYHFCSQISYSDNHYQGHQGSICVAGTGCIPRTSCTKGQPWP
jgi:hypothetical protein